MPYTTPLHDLDTDRLETHADDSACVVAACAIASTLALIGIGSAWLIAKAVGW